MKDIFVGDVHVEPFVFRNNRGSRGLQFNKRMTLIAKFGKLRRKKASHGTIEIDTCVDYPYCKLHLLAMITIARIVSISSHAKLHV